MAYNQSKPHLVWERNGELYVYTDHWIKLDILYSNELLNMAKAKLVWLKDGKFQVYTNKWEEIWEPTPPTPVVHVTGVSLDQHTATLQPEGTLQLTATITPSDATDKKVTWTSSNESVATVSSTGLVTAVANGEATITVRTRDGRYTDTCVITVSTHIPEVQNVELTSFSEESSNTLFVGRAMGTGIKVTPYTASNIQVTVTSSDPNVVSVWEISYDQEPTEYNVGSVSIAGVSEGQATVTITSIDNPSVSKTYSFSVQADIPVTGITGVSTATPTAYTWIPGVIFDAYYTPSNAVAPNEDIVCIAKAWQTDLGSVYCMNTELWTAHMWMSVTPDAVVGTTSIYELFTNRAPENKTEITITVAEGIETFNMSAQDITVVRGWVDTSNEFTYLPTTADINSIQVWTIDPTVATAEIMKTADGSGYVKVTWLSEWSTTVIIGKEYYTQHANFDVTVEAPTPVSSISNLSSTSVNVAQGSSTSITADYLPVDAEDFTNITFVPTVDNIATASVQSASAGTLTIWINGSAVGTTQLAIYINGTDTGLTIDVTVTVAYVLTFSAWNGTSQQAGGGTISENSYTITQDWLSLYYSDCYDFNLHIVPYQGAPAQSVHDVSWTPNDGYLLKRWEYYDENLSDWSGIGEEEPAITWNMQIRCVFEQE